MTVALAAVRVVLVALAILHAVPSPARARRAAHASSPLDPLRELERAGARVSAYFEVDGRPHHAMRPDDLLNPASVTKVFTAAAALDRLGPDRTLETRVTVEGEGDVLTVRVVGSGDPLLRSADLAALARCVKEAGAGGPVRLLVSRGPFDQRHVPPAFETREADAAYRAGIAGFQVDLNAIQVTVTPGAPGNPPGVAVAPASGCVRVTGQVVARGKGRPAPLRVSTLETTGGCTEVRVTGTAPAKAPFVTFRRVRDPAANAAAVFRAALESEGVGVLDVSFVEGGVPPGGPPPLAVCSHMSPPVRDVVVPMLKDSLNPVAESLLRLVGAEGASGPVGFEEGAAALNAFLRDRVGLAAGTFSFRNGSGLYDANRVSARAVVRLLAWARKAPWGEAFAGALSVAGVDGTLKSRMRRTELAGRVRAKTGTLDDVVSLAGFMELAGGREATFAVIVSGPKLDARRARKAVDAALLAVYRASSGGPR